MRARNWLWVVGGYVVAFLAATGVVYLREFHPPPDAMASSGMYAFGDSILFLVVFGVVAIVPTIMALHMLRSSRVFWNVFSFALLLLAATGPLAIVALAMDRPMAPGPMAPGPGLFGSLRLIAAPLLAPGMLVCTLPAPAGRARRILGVATTLEIATAAYFFVRMFFFHGLAPTR